MERSRRPSITPGTAIAVIALFFALGGSAYAVGERIQSPQRRRHDAATARSAASPS